MDMKKFSFNVKFSAIIIALIIVVLNCFSVVSPNEVGVIKTLGKITGTVPRGNGITFKAPFIQSITKLNLAPQKEDFTFTVGQDGAISKDMQTVGVNCSIFYIYNENGAVDYVTNYTENSLNNFFRSNTKTALKTVIGKYSIYDLTGATNEISAEIKNLLSEKCSKMPITISDVNVSNWDWSEDFDKQIKETMNRTQQEKTAKADVAIAEAQAQKQVAEAKAKLEAEKLNAEAVKVAAEADAEAMRTKNAAIQATLSIQRESWEHEETMKRLEKWNGIEPGSNATELIVTPQYSVLPSKNN